MILKYNRENNLIKQLERWDLSEFIEPAYRDNPTRATESLYYGCHSKKKLEGLCEGAIRMAGLILTLAETTGKMSWEARKTVFEIIAEGARRRLFTPNELNEVMGALCGSHEETADLMSIGSETRH